MNGISSLKERLVEDMKDAMKEKDSERLSVIRMVRASIKNKEITNRKDLDDKEVITILSEEVKQRRESAAEYEKSKKLEKVESLKREINILKEYLPEQMEKEKKLNRKKSS